MSRLHRCLRTAVSDHDVAIIGAGCIGLAVAKHLLERSDLDVLVLDKEPRLASHQSGRNSGVLHPGFNYQPGSLKARFAREGTRRLKGFAADHGVPIDEVGVLVVATDADEEARLEQLFERAEANGVDVDRLIGHEAIAAREPHAAGRVGLWCPEAASIDSVAYVRALAGVVRDAGASIRLEMPVASVTPIDGGVQLRAAGQEVTADHVVNAAGVYADRIAHQVGVGTDYRIVPFRGEYYQLRDERRTLTRSMIYPTPDPSLPFLGVHFTRRADGSVIVGPNAVLALGREAYGRTEIDLGDATRILGDLAVWRMLTKPTVRQVALEQLQTSLRKRAFVAAAKRLVPAVERDDLVAGHAGIRAQIVDRDGTLVMEPLIESGAHSTHVLNAVSPGLTASLPFGESVANAVIDRLEG